MKRVGFIYELIMDKSNIRNAIIESSKHKRDKASVREVLSNIDFYIEKVYAILNNPSFVNHYYDQMSIYEKMSGKWRIISRPKYYPDQIVHWAIML